jgi:hypothetical protein
VRVGSLSVRIAGFGEQLLCSRGIISLAELRCIACIGGENSSVGIWPALQDLLDEGLLVDRGGKCPADADIVEGCALVVEVEVIGRERAED